MYRVVVIMSSPKSFTRQHTRIIEGSVLSFRENAELLNYCSLLVGASSGISWLSTAEGIKQIPKVMLLGKDRSVFASMVHDHEYFNLASGHIIEMTECPTDKVFECIYSAITEGFALAHQRFHETIKPEFTFY